MNEQNEISARQWVATICIRYEEQLYEYFSRRHPNSQDVQDFVHEVYKRLLSIKDPARIRDPLAYVRKVAKSVLIDFQRRKKAEPLTFDSERTTEQLERRSADASGNVHQRCDASQLAQEFRRLPEEYRQVLICHLNGLSDEDIGQLLHLTPGTVYQYRRRAIARLFESIDSPRVKGNGRRR